MAQRWRRGTRVLCAFAAGAVVLSTLPGCSFLRTAEWAESSKLSREDALPLIADVTFDVRLGQEDSESTAEDAEDGTKSPRRFAGSASYIADFGILDVPYVRELRARAGLRYSRLYPRGALELAVRKELRSDVQKGYEISLGLQSVGDDKRLDVVTDAGAFKQFRSARAFYRFQYGFGVRFDDVSGGNRYRHRDEKPGWSTIGSSLGITQTDMPPARRGDLTVGWRTGFSDIGLEGVVTPSEAKALNRRRGGGLLESTPYVSYGVQVPAPLGSTARVAWTILPEHDVLQHALLFRVPQDQGGGSGTISAAIDQSISNPMMAKLRVGFSYIRG